MEGDKVDESDDEVQGPRERARRSANQSTQEDEEKAGSTLLFDSVSRPLGTEEVVRTLTTANVLHIPAVFMAGGKMPLGDVADKLAALRGPISMCGDEKRIELDIALEIESCGISTGHGGANQPFTYLVGGNLVWADRIFNNMSSTLFEQPKAGTRGFSLAGARFGSHRLHRHGGLTEVVYYDSRQDIYFCANATTPPHSGLTPLTESRLVDAIKPRFIHDAVTSNDQGNVSETDNLELSAALDALLGDSPEIAVGLAVCNRDSVCGIIIQYDSASRTYEIEYNLAGADHRVEEADLGACY